MVRKLTNFSSSASSLLAELNLTQNELSRRINKNPRYINHIMRGRRNPSAEYIDLIANTLNLSEEDTVRLHRAAAKDCGYKLDLTK